jgi:hypothetical protein
MRLICKAGAAFVLAALITGKLAPDPHWRAVAMELHQAQPQAQVKSKVKARAWSLFHHWKG